MQVTRLQQQQHARPPCRAAAHRPSGRLAGAATSRRARRVAAAASEVAQQPRAGEEHVPVAIAGAGIAGLATAVALHKLGVRVAVLERAPALRQEGAAVALWSNAWRALDALGVGPQLRSDALLLDRIELVSSSGRLLRGFAFQDCAVAGSREMRGVQRPALLQALAAQLPPGTIRFNAGVTQVAGGGGDGSQQQPVLRLSSGASLACDVCVGADGVQSVVAQHLRMPPTNYAGYTAYRGLASYAPGQLPLPANTIRQMFGAGVRAGMYPLSDRQVYWYICWNAPEDAPRPADAAGCVAEALAAVPGWSWGIEQAVRNSGPAGISRSTIRDRWTAGAFGQGAVTLAGDAAHPMTPNLGQGGCTALEDAVELARALAPLLLQSDGAGAAGGSRDSGSREQLVAALRAYEAARSARCLPLTVRSWAFGAALQLPYRPVVALRNAFIQHAFQPAHFLDHTAYDCGDLAAAAAAAV